MFTDKEKAHFEARNSCDLITIKYKLEELLSKEESQNCTTQFLLVLA